jgi:hypothetical protein
MAIFPTKLKWQHSRHSIFDAKSSFANRAAQNGVQNSSGVASRFLQDGQFTIVQVAAKQKDHISGEMVCRQRWCGEGCEKLLVSLSADHEYSFALQLLLLFIAGEYAPDVESQEAVLSIAVAADGPREYWAPMKPYGH